MTRLPVRPSFLALAAALALGGPAALAQDAPASEAPADPAPAPRKAPPRKSPPKAVAPAPAAAATKPPPALPPAAPPPVPPPPRADLTVACAEKAALYEGPNNFSVWVTRTGFVVVENPLRPLTPETSRVLQVVIAGKVATAYGPDLFALRRGGAPAALEAATGGSLRWDPTPTPLPDTLNIVSEAGQPLAQLAFQSCGDAPALKAAPAAKSGDKAVGKDKAAARPRGPKAAPAGPPGMPLPASALDP